MQHQKTQSMVLSKWNQKFVSNVGSREVNQETLNRGASFLVAPHNLTFNKHAIQASGSNHQKVVEGLESILKQHSEAEEKALKGLSPEMAASKKSQKSIEVVRTEAMLNKIMANNGGQQINGRKLVQPDLKLYNKMQKKQFGMR